MRRRFRTRKWEVGLVLGVGLGIWTGLRGGPPTEVGATPLGRPDARVLWAWERPERLAFLPPEAEVAVLVGTIRLAGAEVRRHPRMQPLELPERIRRLAVVRLESDPDRRPSLDAAQRQEVVETTLAWSTSPPGFAGLQIDFDATVSERLFYRRLLEELRDGLPAGTPLSITALASWCLGDPWLAELPIDEAVPMLFRMGMGDAAVRRALARGEEFREPRCRTSYGLASDEPLPTLRGGRRLYLFHPEAWREADFTEFERRLRAAPRARRPVRFSPPLRSQVSGCLISLLVGSLWAKAQLATLEHAAFAGPPGADPWTPKDLLADLRLRGEENLDAIPGR